MQNCSPELDKIGLMVVQGDKGDAVEMRTVGVAEVSEGRRRS